MSSELIKALNDLQREKGIDKEKIIEAIEDSLKAACNKDFGNKVTTNVNMDPETGDLSVFVEKTVVEEVTDSSCEISLEEAKMKDIHFELGDIVGIEVTPKNFGRIAAQHARSIIVQTIKEQERQIIYDEYSKKAEKELVTGVVQRVDYDKETGEVKNINVSLDDRVDTVLTKKEQIAGEVYRPTDHIKLYIVEVKETNKGPKITVSRTHPNLVKRLFESEVAEIRDGTVEIREIAREAGSRTKIAVSSKDPNVDPVGACVGMNGSRVNAIVRELNGEKIDIIMHSDDPRILIENALSPSSVISVDIESPVEDFDIAEGEERPEGTEKREKKATVIVPDDQLSLAIGKVGQNVRLAAKLTGYKIDIMSESQAYEREEQMNEMMDIDEFDDFDM